MIATERQYAKQIDRRSAADRREYMQRYYAQRRLDDGAGGLPHVSVPVMPRCPPAGRVVFFRADEVVRRHLRDGSGKKFWPERRHEFPETLEETCRRV
jgi:hypothetical protein